MDTQINPVTATILAILGLIVSVSIPIVGFVIRQLYARIAEVKADTKDVIDAATIDYKERINEAKKDAKTLVLEEERRRNDAIGGVMTQINTQYTDLKNEMHNVRQDIKDLRDDK